MIRSSRVSWLLIVAALFVGGYVSGRVTGADAHTKTDSQVNWNDQFFAVPQLRSGFRTGTADGTTAWARIKDAANTWEDTNSSVSILNTDLIDGSVLYTTACSALPTGTNIWVVSTFTLPSTWLAGTFLCASGARIDDAMIGIDSTGRTWFTDPGDASGGDWNLQGVVTHEIGHALGGWRGNHFTESSLCPGNSSDQTMCTSPAVGSNANPWTDLGSHDIHTVSNAYPGDDTLGVFRAGSFLLNNSFDGTADSTVAFGQANALPLAGDFDRDGRDTIGYREAGTNQFKLKLSSNTGTTTTVGYGVVTDTPLVGDWNGDGVDTIGIKRGNTYLLRNTNTAGGADITFGYGQAADVPVVGDWNGDGVDTIGVRRGTWFYLRNSNTTGAANISINWGGSADKPVSADWDKDGTDEVGRVTGNAWHFLVDNTMSLSVGPFGYGTSSDVPIPGDWDDDL